MLILKTKELESGMILQKDIKDDTGRLIISSGTVLNSKHLRILKIWGIGEAFVLRSKHISESAKDFRGYEAMEDPNFLYKDQNICAETAKKKFKFNDLEYPFISELYKTYLALECKER